jgi:periplasmic mercuric ion binding protein
MKKLIVFICFVAIAFTSVAQEKKKTETIQIKTSSVCGMCKMTLEKAMAYEKGVKKSNLTVADQMLTVDYDPKKTSPEKIRNAVAKAGYDADAVQADPKAYDRLPGCCKKDNPVH